MRISRLALTFVVSAAIHAWVVTWIIKVYKASPPLFPKKPDVVKFQLFEAPRTIPPKKAVKAKSAAKAGDAEALPKLAAQGALPRYRDLLPSYRDNALHIARGTASSTVRPNADASTAFTHQADLTMFARDFANFFDIPRSVINLYQSQHAELRLAITPPTVAVNKAVGINYLRALLFERMTEFLDKGASKEFLLRSGLSTVFVSVTIRREAVFTAKEMERTVAIDGHHIHFLWHVYDLVKGADLLSAQTDPETGKIGMQANLLAPLMLAYQTFVAPRAEESDPDLKHLRQSPVFSMPIGR